jgi:DNA recombination protein RmuC
MFPESTTYAVIALTTATLFLGIWVLLAVRFQRSGQGRFDVQFGTKLDGVERQFRADGEALRRVVTDMDQGIRKEIADSAREGLNTAFDKVQDGARAQSEQLGRFGGELQDALGNMRGEINRLAETVGTANTGLRSALTEGQVQVSDRLGKDLGELTERLRSGIDGFSDRLRQEQEQLRGIVSQKLDEIRTGNEAKLEQMRRAVDERLQSSLEKGLETTFQRVTEQFAQVQQAIGQVRDVAGQVGDLKRLFSNVKSRGGWAEEHIRALLDDILPVGAYETNLRIGDATGETVEFAVRMPVKGAISDVWLPIDAKFPTEDYSRLLSASEAGDRDAEIVARKALERRIRDEAKRISGKYICPPQTVEFAVMYLPSEGLFAEVYRTPGLVETLGRQNSVNVVGPGLLPAFLHCVRVGHLTLALEQKAGVIGEILGAVKAEWARLENSIKILARRAATLSNGISDTQRRTQAVGRTLRTVDMLDSPRAEELLGLPSEGILVEPVAPGWDEEDPSIETGLSEVIDSDAAEN